MSRQRSGLTVVIAAIITIVMAIPAAAAPFAFPAPPPGLPMEDPPDVSAQSWLLYDASIDRVLASHNPDDERSIASVTKIMTGLLVLERSSPEEIVTVSARAANTGEKEIDLVAGETLPMGALFKALMIHSANDAATAVAEHISGSVEAFVAAMNERAAELGMSHTSFANPHGLDAPGHYSSANDLLILAREAMTHPEFADVVRARRLLFPPDPLGDQRLGSSTNLMLDSYPGVVGVKTGFTFRALLTFVGTAEINGRSLYVIVLGSEGERGHFADATKLLDYGFNTLNYVGAAGLGLPYVTHEPHRAVSPLMVEATAEALNHLASQDLIGNLPPPLVSPGNDDPVDPPRLVTRLAAQPPGSLVGLVRFWYEQLLAP